jgi:hypothetical protein
MVRTGTSMRVLEGPLQGLIGSLAALRPHERVLVLLQILGRRAARRARAGGDHVKLPVESETSFYEKPKETWGRLA